MNVFPLAKCYWLFTGLVAGAEMLEELLEDSDKLTKFVSVCGDLARHHGFHGWLLNIENPVKPHLVPRLLDLCRSLRTKIREEVEDGLVLWYDSVTIEVRDLSFDCQNDHLNLHRIIIIIFNLDQQSYLSIKF